VVYLSRKADLGRLERIIGREGDGEKEDAAGIRRVTLGDVSMVTMSHHGLRVQVPLTGPIIVACHWNMLLSPVGPALHEEGGSRPRSINS